MTNHLLRVLLVSCIRLYQLCFSALVGPACRFEPRCSEYAREAIERHGPMAGIVLGGRRLLRCHPWHPGGYDPVPDRRAARTRSVVRVTPAEMR